MIKQKHYFVKFIEIQWQYNIYKILFTIIK